MKGFQNLMNESNVSKKYTLIFAHDSTGSFTSPISIHATDSEIVFKKADQPHLQ